MECLVEYLDPEDAVSLYSTCRSLYIISRQVYVSSYYAKVITEMIPLKSRTEIFIDDPLRTYNRLRESTDIELHACYGNLDEVRILLRSSAQKPAYVQMALFRACEMGRIEIVKLMTDLRYVDARKNIRDYDTTFRKKVNRYHPRYISRPRPKRDFYSTALDAAVGNGHEDIARLFGWRPRVPEVPRQVTTDTKPSYTMALLVFGPVMQIALYCTIIASLFYVTTSAY